MDRTLDSRRILVFLLFAFGIAWAFGLIIYLTGGLVHSPMVIPSAGLTLAAILLGLGYMFAPALANVFTRLVTREGFDDLLLQPRLRRGLPYWLIAWVLPAILTILGMIVFFLIFPQYYDASLSRIQTLIKSSPQTGGPTNPWVVVSLQVFGGVLVAPLFNSLFTFGEEFGWRAYLLPKLLPLGPRPALVWLGIIWGIWHWPVIIMGYEYGFDYPGFPWVGMLLFIWFTFLAGTFLAWVTLRGDSVWPAVIGHAAMNGIAPLGLLFVQGNPSTLLGPLPIGLIGSVAFAVFALYIFLSPHALAVPEEVAEIE